LIWHQSIDPSIQSIDRPNSNQAIHTKPSNPNTTSRRQARAQNELQAALAQIPAVQQLPAFREADSSGAAVYMVVPSAMDGWLLEASNDLFQQWFRGAEEVRARLKTS
jgi:hypothetical protein